MHKVTQYFKPLTLTTCLIAGLGLAACGKTQQIRGYVFDPELADAITPGIDNRQSVQSTLGTPTVRATFDDSTWYYISTRVRVRPIYWAEPKDHRVLAVSFTDNGVVEGITNYDLDDTRKVSPAPGKTETRGKKLGFFAQIFSNVGRFSGAPPVGANGGTGPNGS